MPFSQPQLLTARDGFTLSATLHRAERDPTVAIIIAPAAGVPQSFYGPFARHLAARGWGALTFDYRGIGGSRPPRLRGFAARARQWGELDIAAAIDWVRQRLSGRPTLLVGHSIAGQVLPLAANARQLDGAYLVAAQHGHWRNWDGAGKLALFTWWHLIVPTASRACGFLPGRLFGPSGRDWPAGVALEWASWGRDRDYLFGRVPGARHAFARFRAPARFISIADDFLGPRRSVDALADRYGSVERSRWHVEPAEVGAERIGHFGFFRERFAETLWRDAVDWLAARARAHA